MTGLVCSKDIRLYLLRTAATDALVHCALFEPLYTTHIFNSEDENMPLAFYIKKVNLSKVMFGHGSVILCVYVLAIVILPRLCGRPSRTRAQ